MNWYIAILCDNDYHYLYGKTITFQADNNEQAIEKAKKELEETYLNSIETIFCVGTESPKEIIAESIDRYPRG